MVFDKDELSSKHSFNANQFLFSPPAVPFSYGGESIQKKESLDIMPYSLL